MITISIEKTIKDKQTNKHKHKPQKEKHNAERVHSRNTKYIVCVCVLEGLSGFRLT